ncbi:MAG: DUF5110 domain-containing protein [Clostridia bacterium]|nr:DUF5110 domain-containing protein [Clostridia bacterium]
MLEKHLIVKTYPKADSANVVTFGDYRVTVLFDRLFRIEKNKKGEFNDEATQSIWYRNTPKVDFEVKTSQGYVEIKTAAVTLHLAKRFDKSFVLINGERRPINNDGNLRGTTRTLDMYTGAVYLRTYSNLELDTGVCSRTGVAVVDDTESLRLLESGKLCEKSSDEMDIYVFAYGDSYREAVQALYAICGATPMLPRYSFGNWWSRYHVYTDEEYVDLMDKFKDYGIPLTVATVDMDWHYADYVDEEKNITAEGKISAERGTDHKNKARIGWTGYSWNKNLFPDYKKFLSDLKERNLRVTLNLHPADGVRYFEDMYEEMATAMGIDPATERKVEFDIANDDFVNNYFKILHHPYEKDGVDFWWIDWQQGTKSAMAGLDPLWALNHYHYYDNGRDGKHPLIMSRYAGVGSHRYPIGFSGDTTMTWESLKFMPYFTSTATNVGYTWWGHDIGGHMRGKKDDELYLRFLQFGVFNPFNRLHSTLDLIVTKEPWAYKNGIGELSREAMILRHKMIPFLHTANYRTHKEGLGLVEPMYYEYAKYPESYECPGQYIFGGSLIVAPITAPSDDAGLCKMNVWLPEGVWTDIFTGDVYRIGAEGKWIEMVRHLDSIPALAKAGTVLPFSLDEGNGCANPKSLGLDVYNGDGSYTLYEDDEKGTAAFTVFNTTSDEGTVTVDVSFTGDFSVLPEGREMTFSFKNIVVNTSVDMGIGLTEKRFANVEVFRNGERIDAKVTKYGEVKVTVSDIDYGAEYKVRVIYSPLKPLEEAKRTALLKLMTVEDSLTVRKQLMKDIETKAFTVENVACLIIGSDIHESEKARLIENMLY